MHVLLVANTDWNLTNFRLGLIRELQAQGYRVSAAAAARRHFRILRREGVRYHDLVLDGKTRNPFKDFLLLCRLYWLYRAVRPDVVLHFTIKPNIYGSLACALLGIPVVNNVTGLGIVFAKKGLVSRIVRLLYRIAFDRASRTFFQNSSDLNLFLRHGIVDGKRAGKLPGSGVDTRTFSPQEKRQDGPLVFLLVARMIWQKGIEEFVRASELVRADHPGTEFRLAGELGVNNPSAIPEDRIRQWERTGLIRYLGFSEDIRQVIGEADCVILPSYYPEGVPRTLLEAASMAVPIITTDTPGCRDAVDDGVNGFLCRPRDAQDLARKMALIIGMSPAQRLQMGRAGRAKMRREFDESIVVQKYLEAIRAAVAEGSKDRQ